MKMYLTGCNLDWFNNNEYFNKVLTKVWMDHNDDHMEYFVDTYIPLLIKEIVGSGDVLVYNPMVLFINCLDSNLGVDYDSLFKSLCTSFSEIIHDYEGNIELILPAEYEDKDSFEECIIKSISCSMIRNQLVVRTMEQVEKSNGLLS